MTDDRDERGLITDDAAPDGQHHGRIIVNGVGEWQPVTGEAPTDFQQYARSMKEWVPVSGGSYHFVLGLTHDDTTGDVNLTPAGWAPELLGGVYTNGGRSATEGLDLNIAGNGLISAPLATDLLAGTFTEPPQDGLPYARKFDTTTTPAKWIWEPTVAAGLQITGLIPDNVLIPSTTPVLVTAYGAEFTPTCVIRIDGVDVVPQAVYVSPTVMTFTIDPTPELVGRIVTVTVHDPVAVPPALVDGMGAEPFEFQELIEALYRGRWQPATNTPDIVTLTKEDQWMWVADIVDPTIPEVPLVALPGIDPTIAIKEGDHVVWDETSATFLLISSGSLPYHFGQGLTFDDATRVVDLQPAGGIVDHMGGVWVPPRTELQGLEIDPNFTGELRAPLATDLLAGSIIEPPPDDKGYVRRRDLAGVSAWVPPADTPLPSFGVGLSQDTSTDPTDPPNHQIINLQPAGDSPATLGGVYVIDRVRNVEEGLELGIDGRLRVPLATDNLAGAIVEPPPDDMGYVRRRDVNGVSAWVPPSDTPLPSFGVGLSQDDSTDPTDPVGHQIINLQPAGDGPATLGGVYVIDRVRNVEEGLELGIDGRLRVPLATDSLAGAIVEPPPDDMGYVRRRDLSGVSAWVPPSDTPLPSFGVGLSQDDSTDPTDPPGHQIINLQPAGDSPATLGGVYVIDRVRNIEEGLELGIDGQLRAPLATPRLAGTIVEPEDDGKGYVRTTLNGVSAWVPPAGQPATDFGTGLSLDETADPWIVHLQIATDFSLGGIMEPVQDGLAYSRQFDAVAQVWKWVPALTAGLQITSIIPDKAIYGPSEPLLTVHVYGSEFTTTTVVHVDDNPAATTYVSPTELTFVMNPAVPISDSFHIITVHDPVAVPPALVDGLGAEQFSFVKASTEVDYGIGLQFDTTPTPPMVNLTPAGPAPQFLGGVWVPPRDHQQGLSLYPGADPLLMGQLTLPLATPFLAGAMIEPPQDDKGYVRRTDITTGIGAWVPPASQSSVTISDTPPANPAHEDLWWESDSGKMFIYYDDGTSAQWVEAVQVPEAGGTYHFAIGLTHDDVTGDVNLLPAGDTPATLGGIYVVDRVRTATSGLELDIDGQLRAPLATEIYAGTIVDPPPDGLPYVRKRDTAGVSTWVPPTGGVIISDTPPPNPTQGAGWWESDSGDLFIWYDDGTSAQWVQVNGVSPPPGVTVSDDPPMSPTPNALWWDSNAGTLNLWYTDVDTSQWVQIAAPQIPGVPEAPIDGVPYSRRDANWVATTSLAATPGDVKDGFQVNDHGGWIKLDGRLVNTLTSTQQAQAALLGFTTNLPNAASAVGLMNGTAMGLVAGAMTKTIAVANLPAHNMTSGGHDAGAVTTSSYDPGAVTTSNALNETAGDGPNKGNVASGGTGDDYWLANGTHSLNHSHTVDMPAHTHTVDMPNHTHTVALGGSGTPLDVTPKSMSINKFVFLGV